jgi:MSHA pilin protein MshC
MIADARSLKQHHSCVWPGCAGRTSGGPGSRKRPGPLPFAAAGFTLPEMLATMVIIAVLAAVALPRFFDKKSFDALRYYDQSLAAVRFAQKVAIAQRSVSGIYVVVSANTLSVCYDSGCASRVADPGTGGALTLAAPGGISISASPASSFSFDALGKVAAGTITVTVSASGEPSRTFTVEGETGYAHP